MCFNFSIHQTLDVSETYFRLIKSANANFVDFIGKRQAFKNLLD